MKVNYNFNLIDKCIQTRILSSMISIEKHYIFNLNIIKFSEVKLTPKICADGKES